MLTVTFDCPKCGLVKHAVEVPARKTSDEDVVLWFREVVIASCCAEHDRVSPNCHPKSLKNLLMAAPPEAEFLEQQIE